MNESTQLFCKSLPVQRAWDATSLSIFQACPRKYQLSIIDGWRSKKKSPPLLFGGLLHAAQEQYDRLIIKGETHDRAQIICLRSLLKATTQYVKVGWNPDEEGKVVQVWQSPNYTTRENAEASPVPDIPHTEAYVYPRFWSPENAKGRSRFSLCRTFVWYTEQFKNDVAKTMILPDGRPAIELSFSFDLPWTNPDGDPYLWCGHIDKLVTYGEAKTPMVVDRKHTATTVGSYYFDKFSPNNQITGYLIASDIILTTPVVCMIIDAAQVAVSFSRFARGMITLTKEQKDEWMEDTRLSIQTAEGYAKTEYYPMNRESCHNYGGCQFRGICSKSPSIRETFLESDFNHEPWNPLEVRGADDE